MEGKSKLKIVISLEKGWIDFNEKIYAINIEDKHRRANFNKIFCDFYDK